MNILTDLTDVVLSPFRYLPPFWGIVFLALLTAVFILLIYKAVSNQVAIKKLKKRILGHFLGIYIFRDDAGQILKTEMRLLAAIAKYLGQAIRPLLIIIVPVLLLCTQMQLRYGYRTPRPGEEMVVSLRLSPSLDLASTKIGLEVPPGISVLTPALRILGLNEVDWRIRVLGEGKHQLLFLVNAGKAGITVNALPGITRIYPFKERAGFTSLLKYPGQEPLAGSPPVLSLGLGYPPATINVLGLHLHWALVYFALAILFGFLLKRPFRIEF